MIMEFLEILVDVLTFYDLQEEDNYFDAGTFAGKGLINACFTLYYVILDNFVTPPPADAEEEVDVVDL